MDADSSRPITDWFDEVMSPAGIGLTLGTLIGPFARRYASAVLYLLRGYGAAEVDLPSYGTFTAFAASIGGIAMIVLWAVEPLL